MSSATTVRRGEARLHRHVEHVMGMPVSVALRGRHARTPAGCAAWRAVITELRDVDRVFSTYRDDSVINRLGRGELTLEQCPVEVAEVMELGRQAERRSGGAFSVHLPGPDGRLRLDASGVVKGWAVQRAARFFSSLADTDFCFSAGGDIICHTTGAAGDPWRIGIEHPHDPRSLIAVVPVRAGAVATSSTAHRGHHLLDARTGRPVQGVASVTVIGRSLDRVDIDATSAYAQGGRAASWLRTRPGRTALVVWPDASTTVIDGRLSTS